MKISLLPLLITTCLTGLIHSQENAHTSVESIKEALKLDRRIGNVLKKNLKDLEEYRKLVEQYLDEQDRIENEMKASFPNKQGESWDESKMDEKIAGNPLIAFQAIRRIASDIHSLSSRMDAMYSDLHTLVEEDVKNNENVKVTYKEDLLGAATGILRLQSTYHMSASDLAVGKIQHLNSSSRLTVSDCLLLAKSAKDMKTLDLYAEWREQAHFLCRGIKENEEGCLRLTESLLLEAVLEHDQTWNIYVEELKKNQAYHMEQHVFPNKLERFPAGDQRRNIVERKRHGPKTQTSLCFISNELLGEVERSKLYCHYLTNPNDPFVTMQRFKMEVQSRTPLITTIHDVINEAEADYIKETAKPFLRRSVVGRNSYSELVSSENRISQTAWISDEGPMKTISRRISRITGLATDGSNSEEFQVVNYGIGGLFRDHIDVLDREADFLRRLNESSYMGNRLVTFMIYLSDVEMGGATNFIKANVSVYPKKGSATMWYNLDNGGSIDFKVVHGGCPVLFGSKWIANKWIFERGQLFRKPCLAKTLT